MLRLHICRDLNVINTFLKDYIILSRSNALTPLDFPKSLSPVFKKKYFLPENLEFIRNKITFLKAM